LDGVPQLTVTRGPGGIDIRLEIASDQDMTRYEALQLAPDGKPRPLRARTGTGRLSPQVRVVRLTDHGYVGVQIVEAPSDRVLADLTQVYRLHRAPPAPDT
jgi:hypothetical protein